MPPGMEIPQPLWVTQYLTNLMTGKFFLLSHPDFPRGVPAQLPGLQEGLWHCQVTVHKSSPCPKSNHTTRGTR